WAVPQLVLEISREVATDFQEGGTARFSLATLREGYVAEQEKEGQSIRFRDFVRTAFSDEVLHRLKEDHRLEVPESDRGLLQADTIWRGYLDEIFYFLSYFDIEEVSHDDARFHSLFIIVSLFINEPNLTLSELRDLVYLFAPDTEQYVEFAIRCLKANGYITTSIALDGQIQYHWRDPETLTHDLFPAYDPASKLRRATIPFLAAHPNEAMPSQTLSNLEVDYGLKNLSKLLRLIYGDDPSTQHLSTQLAGHLAIPILENRQFLGTLHTLQSVLRWRMRRDEIARVALLKGEMEIVFDQEVEGDFVHSAGEMVDVLIRLAAREAASRDEEEGGMGPNGPSGTHSPMRDGAPSTQPFARSRLRSEVLDIDLANYELIDDHVGRFAVIRERATGAIYKISISGWNEALEQELFWASVLERIGVRSPGIAFVSTVHVRGGTFLLRDGEYVAYRMEHNYSEQAGWQILLLREDDLADFSELPPELLLKIRRNFRFQFAALFANGIAQLDGLQIALNTVTGDVALIDYGSFAVSDGLRFARAERNGFKQVGEVLYDDSLVPKNLPVFRRFMDTLDREIAKRGLATGSTIDYRRSPILVETAARSETLLTESVVPSVLAEPRALPWRAERPVEELPIRARLP
ncbi:MAG: hypothetical protein Q7S98_02775, partial [Deltaproteobacteria bacterium]|nr:hypothetical protein [Deltaproteobacteria bacterium]